MSPMCLLSMNKEIKKLKCRLCMSKLKNDYFNEKNIFNKKIIFFNEKKIKCRLCIMNSYVFKNEKKCIFMCKEYFPLKFFV